MLTRNCLLLFLWFLFDKGLLTPLQSPPHRKLGKEHPGGIVGLLRNVQPSFQRVKRGWVWNQFFVLEEYMGSDPQYVGKQEHSERTTQHPSLLRPAVTAPYPPLCDSPLGSEREGEDGQPVWIRERLGVGKGKQDGSPSDEPRGAVAGVQCLYSIDWKSDLDSYFEIDPVEGTIATKELLDRENMAQHNISIVATKVNNPVLSSKVAVIVHVLDVNEFPPELSIPYETFVCENSKTNQLIQTVSANDRDLPPAGQKFFFKLPPEATTKHNFTVYDYGNNTAGILTKRNGYSRRMQEIYFLPVVIEDSGYPVQSSTNTLTIRVCGCATDGTLLSCNVEAIFLPVGLSTGALIAILVCIIILLVIVVLYVGLRRQKRKETLMTSKEDIRDNVIHYDDEGGGEEDTHAFDMGTLRNPKVIKDNTFRRDVKPETETCPKPPISQESADIRDFIHQRLQENDINSSAPPYDSLATYAYEGDGSVAESLSSIESLATDADEDYDYLREWGPRFKTLAGIFEEYESHLEKTDKL
ncbi:Cadherin-12 [Acipenser ruthenus]|uniref:Cadherin-12 n=1 Tax=Acipenser ruthenus TaxID=7906 RepID=A0A444U2L1_ACIRT|nr:Cadherin-12 [Acipenser ruthenus]